MDYLGVRIGTIVKDNVSLRCDRCLDIIDRTAPILPRSKGHESYPHLPRYGGAMRALPAPGPWRTRGRRRTAEVVATHIATAQWRRRSGRLAVPRAGEPAGRRRSRHPAALGRRRPRPRVRDTWRPSAVPPGGPAAARPRAPAPPPPPLRPPRAPPPPRACPV